MAVVAVATGRGATLTFSGLTMDLLEISIDFNRGEIESTTLATAAGGGKTYIPEDLYDATISGRVQFDHSDDYVALMAGASATATIDWDNSDTGGTVSISAFMTQFSASSGDGTSIMEASCSMRCTGDATYTAGA